MGSAPSAPPQVCITCKKYSASEGNTTCYYCQGYKLCYRCRQFLVPSYGMLCPRCMSFDMCFHFELNNHN